MDLKRLIAPFVLNGGQSVANVGTFQLVYQPGLE
jgi:hypothetical protein